MAFRERYSAAQRETLVRAAIDYGLSVRHAVELANRGELPGAPDGLPAFDIGAAYAGDLIRAEKQRRGIQEKASATPETIMRQSLGMLAVRLDREVQKLRGRRKVSGEEIAGLAKAGREVAALARAVHGLPQPATNKPRAKNPDGNGSFIAALADRDDVDASAP